MEPNCFGKEQCPISPASTAPASCLAAIQTFSLECRAIFRWLMRVSGQRHHPGAISRRPRPTLPHPRASAANGTISLHVRGHRTISCAPLDGGAISLTASAANVTISPVRPRQAGPSPSTSLARRPSPRESMASWAISLHVCGHGTISPRVPRTAGPSPRASVTNVTTSPASGAISPHARGRRGHALSPPHVRGH